MCKIVTSSNLNPPLNFFFFYLLILTNNNLLLKIYCENIIVIIFNYDFLFFILFFFLSFHFHPFTVSFLFFFFPFSFSCFSPPHKCLAPLLLFSFSPQEHSSNSFASHQRERAARPPMEIEVAERTSQWRSAFTTRHYHVRRPTAAHPPPYHLGQISVLLFFLFFFFHICLF